MFRKTVSVAGLGLVLCAAAFAGDPFELTWNTIAGGGATISSGGAFELGGTIGQAGAGSSPPMAGGAFELTGGFPAGTIAPSCACLGDMNGDGQRNGGDIQIFVGCLLNGGSCLCADVDGLSGVTLDDADAFVIDLLGNGNCE